MSTIENVPAVGPSLAPARPLRRQRRPALRLVTRHYFDFRTDRELVADDLLRPERWDALRTKSTGAFAMARTRTELQRQLEAHPEIVRRAAAIVEQSVGAGPLASYGVGGAVLEAAMLDLRKNLILAEYAPETVARLGELLPEVDVAQHDLRREDPLPADLHLFHRVDTELSCEEWRDVFRRFAGERIIFVAAEICDVRRLALGLGHRLALGRGATRAGWLRNRPAFEALWSETHHHQRRRFHDLEGWFLWPAAEPRP